jgi:hypothetical protein
MVICHLRATMPTAHHIAIHCSRDCMDKGNCPDNVE